MLAILDGVKPSAIGHLFPHDDDCALFVMTMCMARNDLVVDIEYGKEAADGNIPTWRYFTKSTYIHLFEAIDALNQWRDKRPNVKKLLAELPDEVQADLKTVRGVLQRVSHSAIKQVRDSASHYPSPHPRYSSSEKLAEILETGSEAPLEIRFLHDDEFPRRFTFEFASLVSLALAFSKHSPEPDELKRQDAQLHEAAMAFQRFSIALFELWMTKRKFELADIESSDPG